jgi:DNA invertase Pin-like site-specific DNA recombinase
VKIYKAAKYLRISYAGEKNVESDSIQNQNNLIDDFLKNNPDIEAVSEKIDDGYSGVVFDRPAFKEMMQDIADGKINCVIVKDLSRLGREYIDTGRYLRRIFPAYGVRFIAINDSIDTLREDTSGEYLSVSLKNIMNDAYCRDISVKTRSALTTKRKNGDYIGACPVYGYLKSEDNKNQLIIDECVAGTVKDIFRMKINGASASKIAEKLNNVGVLSPCEYKKQNGMPHPTGGFADNEDSKWSATTIIRILKDETYTGTLLQGKQTSLNYKLKEKIQNPVAEWQRTENAHAAIIRKHDFDLVQRIMHLDTRSSPGENKVYIFSGILICGCCGSRMARKTNTYKDKKHHYYYCRTGKKNGCTAPTMLKESELIECVAKSLKSHIKNVASLQELMDTINEEAINSELIKKHTAQITTNEKSINQLSVKYLSGHTIKSY